MLYIAEDNLKWWLPNVDISSRISTILVQNLIALSHTMGCRLSLSQCPCAVFLIDKCDVRMCTHTNCLRQDHVHTHTCTTMAAHSHGTMKPVYYKHINFQDSLSTDKQRYSYQKSSTFWDSFLCFCKPRTVHSWQFYITIPCC